MTVDPLENGRQSRVTIELDFNGHGIGKLLVPLFVRREAEKEMPANLRTPKERLEEQRFLAALSMHKRALRPWGDASRKDVDDRPS